MEADLAVPCLMDQFNPQTAWNMVKVLEYFKIKVHYNTAQTCCGFTAYTAGQRTLSDKLTEKYLDEFSGLRTVVCPDQSCTRMVRDYMGADVGNLAIGNKVKGLNKIFRTFTEVMLEQPESSFDKLKLKLKVTALPSCQCTNRRAESKDGETLFKRIKALRFMPMEKLPVCCGFGGPFHLVNPETANNMAAQVFEAVINAGADYLICDDSGCQLHLKKYAEEHKVPVVVWHLADLIAESISSQE